LILTLARVEQTLLSADFDFDIELPIDGSSTNACTAVEERRFQRRVKTHTIPAGFSPNSLSADVT
jgi:hypothetical protein